MTHRIRRAVFELRLADEPSAFRRRKQMEEAFHRTILPVLEEAFDGLAPGERVLGIDRLEIDLGRIDLDGLDVSLLRQAILAEVRSQVRSLPAAEREPLPAVLSLEETLAAFLEAGVWPWGAVVRSAEALEAALVPLPAAEARRVARRVLPLLQRGAVRLRVAYQFSPAFARWLIAQLHPNRADEVWRVAAAVLGEGPAGPITAAVLAAAVALAGDAEASHATVRRWLSEEHARLQPARAAERAGSGPGATLPLVEGSGREPELPEPAAGREPAAYYVSAAGIVLLHPFLPSFFRHVGLVTDGEPLASLDQRVRAVHLLHHLATGGERPDEHETTLLKLLGGLPLQYPLPRDLPLSAEERAEAESLLAAAIGHWGKLGNTSSAGLREAFLRREGRLAARADGWQLTVEQRAVDVLLASLPWSVSIVRLPWMATSLRVDWA